MRRLGVRDMNYTILTVISGIVMIMTTNFAFGENQLNNAILAPFIDSDIVVVGKVIDAKNMTSENETQYDVTIEKYLKGSNSSDTLSAIGSNIRKEIANPSKENYFNQAVFEKGDRVFLYLNQENGQYVISPFSFLISGNGTIIPPGTAVTIMPDKNSYYGTENVTILGVINKGYMYTSEAEYGKNSTVSITVSNPDNGKYLMDQIDIKPDGSFIYQFKIKGQLGISGTYGVEVDVSGSGHGITFDYIADPLNQYKSGMTAKNVTCTEGLQLVIKAEDGSPACVKPRSVNILIERGWGHIP